MAVDPNKVFSSGSMTGLEIATTIAENYGYPVSMVLEKLADEDCEQWVDALSDAAGDDDHVFDAVCEIESNVVDNLDLGEGLASACDQDQVDVARVADLLAYKDVPAEALRQALSTVGSSAEDGKGNLTELRQLATLLLDYGADITELEQPALKALGLSKPTVRGLAKKALSRKTVESLLPSLVST